MVGDWKLTLWRPHIGQILILFSIVAVLISSVILFIVVPENQDLSSRVKVIETILYENLLKNQEAVIASANRIEASASRIEAASRLIHDDLETLAIKADERGAAREREHKELKDLLSSRNKQDTK